VIPGHTGVAGGEGYRKLPFKRGVLNCTANGPDTPCIETAWMPTPEELAILNLGGAVYVRTLGTQIVPMNVYVGDPPRDPSIEGRAEIKP
jgi:hypothetical protein